MIEEKTCAVCLGEMKILSGVSSLGHLQIQCVRCGKYRIVLDAWQDFRNQEFLGKPDITKRSNLSAWIRENQDILIENSKRAFYGALKAPTFENKAQKALLLIERMTLHAGQYVPFMYDKSTFLSPTWSQNFSELREIIGYHIKEGRLARNNRGYVKITPEGWSYLESIKTVNPESQQGFVAMWFDKSMNPIWEGPLQKAIYDAGYKPERVDMIEHAGKIDDLIISQINMSRFVVADFTGHRGGVYFEAGYAMGKGLPVIWTCREDEIKKLHFDTRQYNFIDWKAEEDLEERLKNRIIAVLGKGNYKIEQPS